MSCNRRRNRIFISRAAFLVKVNATTFVNDNRWSRRVSK